MSQWTEDRFFNGALCVRQDRKGYRFSIDAAIAAYGVTPKAGETIVDLGTGCGIIPLILAYRHADIKVFGVEIQEGLADLARFNINQNQFEKRIKVLHADMRSLQPGLLNSPVEWVVCNPPYRPPNSGRVNPDRQRALARHEININLNQMIQSADRLLSPGGRLVTIYPAERLVEVLCEMHSRRIEPKWIQMIHSRSGESARLVMVRGVKGGRPGVTIEDPLIIYKPNGSYTSQMEAMMNP
jgi:tRNA1Val (adenine37-N6)-methyltransferase